MEIIDQIIKRLKPYIENKTNGTEAVLLIIRHEMNRVYKEAFWKGQEDVLGVNTATRIAKEEEIKKIKMCQELKENMNYELLEDKFFN